MDSKVCGKLLTTHQRGLGDDVEALRGRFPSGRMLEKAPRWDLMGTEGYGGGKVFWWTLLVIWEYLGIYRAKIRVGGVSWAPQARGAPPRARPDGLWSPRDSPAFNSKFAGYLLVQEKSSRKFYSVWTPFDIPFL